MREHLKLYMLALRLDRTEAEIKAIATELGIKVIQSGDTRWIRLSDAGRIVSRVDAAEVSG
jgi:hypothetical protein